MTKIDCYSIRNPLHIKNILPTYICDVLNKWVKNSVCSYRSSLVRNFSLTSKLSSEIDADFEQAKQTLNVLKSEPGNDVKLQIYALFKQVDVCYYYY